MNPLLWALLRFVDRVLDDLVPWVLLLVVLTLVSGFASG